MAIRVFLVLVTVTSLTGPMAAATPTPKAAEPAAAAPAPEAAADAPPVDFAHEAALKAGKPLDVQGQFLLEMLKNAAGRQFTERDLFLYRLAMMEQAGDLPEGTTMWAAGAPAALAAAQREKEPIPEFIFREPYRVCDVDDDGVRDLVFNEIDPIQPRVQVRMISGADGHILWIYYGQWYVTARAISPLYGRHVLATPDPKFFENFAPTLDVNDDGVCDMMFADMQVDAFGIDPVIIQIDASVRVVNGSYAYQSLSSFWTRNFKSTIVITFDPTGCCFLSIVGDNVPSGFLHADSKNGARWVWKETDIFFTLARDGIVTGFFVYDWRNTDTIHYIASKDGRHDIWSRDLNFTREYNPTASNQEHVTNFTYLTGAVQLAGNDELEIVIDQRQATTPQTPGLRNPITGEPMFVYGSAITMLSLRGEDGKNHWSTLILDTGTVRVNAALEESFELLVWTYGQVLCDMTGDGIAEVLSTSLWVQTSSQIPTTTNGLFTTHIHPLDGATGKKLWPTLDQRAQGWGYAACMSARPDASVPYMAFGTVDLPTAVPPAGRFPPKDVRLTVFDMGGQSLWSYREQFAQDSYIAYHVTLHQYRSALAPADYNGDGIKELLTPAQYVQAIGANQTLLSQAVHLYGIYDGKEGLQVSGFQAWGPMGQATICRPDDPTITVFGGHSRRLDVSRFNITPRVSHQWWRYPIYNNPSIQSATLGTDISTWSVKCLEDMDGSLIFAINMGMVSAKRGGEVKSVYGLVLPNEDNADVIDLEWINPPVKGKPPVDIEQILTLFDVEQPSPALTLAFTAGPAVPGLVAGIGLGRFRVRKGGIA